VLAVREAQEQGVDVSCETCPHYLLFTESDLEQLGGIGKCAPPFRDAQEVEGLWRLLVAGTLPMVVSDHSPSSIDLKRGDDFFRLWGGLSGCQSTRQLLLAAAAGRGIDLAALAAMTAGNQARRFGLAAKGEIAVGFDADMWLVDLSQEWQLQAADLFYLNRFSAFEGRPLRGQTARTVVRGITVFQDGRPVSGPVGRLLVADRGRPPSTEPDPHA
jgi:allantoinase